jgi:hypothetical protein
MSQPTATATLPTRAPADRDRDGTNQTDHTRQARPSRLWPLIEALAYAGAYVDPSGILAVERLRRAREEQEALDGRR